jgi:hypothetical protein
MEIPVYANILRGNKTLVGSLKLDPRALPDDTFYSICLVLKPDGPYKHTPVAATLVDDYDFSLGLSNAYGPGSEFILSLMNKR